MNGRAEPVSVDARPAPVELVPSRTAVIVVDMQNDFATPGGMFERAGIDIRPIAAIVEPTRAVLEAARDAGVLVVYLKMGFLPDLSDAGAPASPTWLKHLPLHAGDEVVAPDGSPSRVLIRDTWNTDIIDAVRPEPGDVVVDKHRYSGFFGTELDDQLRARDIEHLVFVGATTSVCVESTVRDAMFRDYHCLVLEDCTAEPIGADTARSNHEASLLVLQLLFASISDSSAVLDALASRSAIV
jgi:ureidoacrylate peracid hydrolase